MNVRREVANVFYGGGRRWFTLDAACRAEAKATIHKRCDCSKDDWTDGRLTPGESCKYHSDADLWLRLRNRLARNYKRRYLTAALDAQIAKTTKGR